MQRQAVRTTAVTSLAGTISHSGTSSAQTMSGAPPISSAEQTTSAMQRTATVLRWRDIAVLAITLPRLRLRHMPFTIGPLQRDRWLQHMTAAVDATTHDPDVRAELLTYFRSTAEHMRNDTGLPISSAGQRRPSA